MEPSILYSIMTLGFGLGLLHALDADHIMAVSVLASANGQNAKAWSIRRMLRFCCAWAFGHGAVLFSLALLLVFAEVELPTIIADFAEKLIGVFLIILGGWVLYTIRQHRLSLQVHCHDDLTHVHLTHVHLTHVHLTNTRQTHDTHSSVLVGVTHGFAGSAPVLALIPAMKTTSAWIGLSYIMLFSLGVLCAMLVFGLFFGRLQQWLARLGQKVFQLSRMLMASACITLGCYWFLG